MREQFGPPFLKNMGTILALGIVLSRYFVDFRLSLGKIEFLREGLNLTVKLIPFQMN